MTQPIAFLDGPWWPYLALVLFGFLPSEIWRWAAVLFARGIDENSEIIVWVRSVATTLVMAVVARLVFFPTGALATAPGFVRIGALGVGLAAFFLFRRSIAAGVILGEAALIGAAWWFGMR